jgi:3-oxo-5alpha-steroid 4-dehydrogenase
MTEDETPDSPNWLSQVLAPERVGSAEDVAWDEEADLVVVGYGGAGVAAALQAREEGLSVIALDRFEGGGSTAMNGGIVYAGAGTAIQQAAGVTDSAEEMFKYLQKEVQGVVSDATLRRFCEESPALIDWAMRHGVEFRPSLYSKKTSYPPLEYYLYHPDSSLAGSYKAIAKPAARGHKVYSDFMSKTATGFGVALYNPLRDSAARLGVKVETQAEVRQLIVDSGGRVIGVKTLQFPPGSPEAEQHRRYLATSRRLLLALPPQFPGGKLLWALAARYGRRAKALEDAHRAPRRIRARAGICLSAGGFIYNRAMVAALAPKYVAGMPLGNPGDDGSGIRLGQSVGGAVDRMHHLSGWRFINPPGAFSRGMLVNARGERFCDEMLYGAAIGHEMCEFQDGKAYIILDRGLYRLAWRQIFRDKLLPFQRDPAALALLFPRGRSDTLSGLARRLGFDETRFATTVLAYNDAAGERQPDAFGKLPEDMDALSTAPYYAIDVSITSRLFPMATLTLGGLVVDEASGQVCRKDGTAIAGLYAAGRTAIGICSHLYVSGLSAADCLFSGRRAAQHAAAVARQPEAAATAASD